MGQAESLSDSAPTNADDAHDQFLSDPRRPVPFIETISTGMTVEYMTADQRFAARRPDVLVYATPPLTTALTLAGPLSAELYVSTSQSDADWVVKLIDVFPLDAKNTPSVAPGQALGGYQMLVRSEVVRGRFRDDPSSPRPFTPEEVTKVTVPLQDVLHRFQPGHRLMIQVHSTWFPLVDRNPQKYVDNIYLADDGDFVPATHRVFRNQTSPSCIEMMVLED